MKTVIPTRSQLGYANGDPRPHTLVEGDAIDVPDDLAEALIAGGDATLVEPSAPVEPPAPPVEPPSPSDGSDPAPAPAAKPRKG